MGNYPASCVCYGLHQRASLMTAHRRSSSSSLSFTSSSSRSSSSSSSSSPSSSPTSPYITIIDPSSMRTCRLLHPISIAELMIQYPNYFIAEFSNESFSFHGHGHIHRMVMSPLPADHATRAFHVYFLLPMYRLHTRITPDEIQHLYELLHCSTSPDSDHSPINNNKKANKTGHHKSCKKIQSKQSNSIKRSLSFPVLNVIEDQVEEEHGMSPPSGGLGDKGYEVAFLGASSQGNVLQHRRLTCNSMRMRPSWAPKLMTIVESSPLMM